MCKAILIPVNGRELNKLISWQPIYTALHWFQLLLSTLPGGQEASILLVCWGHRVGTPTHQTFMAYYVGMLYTVLLNRFVV